MQGAIKALNNRVSDCSEFTPSQPLMGKSNSMKRKIAETSNVITETLPSVDTEQVEIEVIGEAAIEVEEAGLEEVVDAARNAQQASDDSALALLADITSKYQQGETSLHGVKKEDPEELVYQEETVTDSKVGDNVEVVEVQISQLDNMFRCNKCERSFKLYYHLKQHMRAHVISLEKPHVCRHCGKAYTREGALKQHVNTFHFEAEELSRGQKPQKKLHTCEYCDKQFDHFGHFKEHLRKHTGEKPYECPDCHERFARNSTLKCHMTACQNGCGAKKGRKKLYECQVCSSVFNCWDLFKDHLVTHTGDKPNHCTMCDLWFTQPQDLQVHFTEAHGVQDLIADPNIGIAIGTHDEAILLEDSMHVEHVTVEPVDVVAMEHAALVMEDEVMTEMCEEDVARLKEAGLEIQVVQVSTGEQGNSEVRVKRSVIVVEKTSESV